MSKTFRIKLDEDVEVARERLKRVSKRLRKRRKDKREIEEEFQADLKELVRHGPGSS